MNPSNNSAGMELPPPVSEKQPTPPEMPAANQETGPAPAFEQAPSAANSGAQAIAPPPLPPIPLPPTAKPPASNSGTTSISAQPLQDKDLIEKEWVNKAKAIVEKTKDDPYKQSEELTLLRADYMKQHYNKTLKLSK